MSKVSTLWSARGKYGIWSCVIWRWWHMSSTFENFRWWSGTFEVAMCLVQKAPSVSVSGVNNGGGYEPHGRSRIIKSVIWSMTSAWPGYCTKFCWRSSWATFLVDSKWIWNIVKSWKGLVDLGVEATCEIVECQISRRINGRCMTIEMHCFVLECITQKSWPWTCGIYKTII